MGCLSPGGECSAVGQSGCEELKNVWSREGVIVRSVAKRGMCGNGVRLSGADRAARLTQADQQNESCRQVGR